MPCLPPGDLPDSGTEPRSAALQVDSLSSEVPGKLEAIALIQMSRAGNPRGTSEGVQLQCNFWLEKERCQGGPRFGQGQQESWTFIPWDGEIGEEAI